MINRKGRRDQILIPASFFVPFMAAATVQGPAYNNLLAADKVLDDRRPSP